MLRLPRAAPCDQDQLVPRQGSSKCRAVTELTETRMPIVGGMAKPARGGYLLHDHRRDVSCQRAIGKH